MWDFVYFTTNHKYVKRHRKYAGKQSKKALAQNPPRTEIEYDTHLGLVICYQGNVCLSVKTDRFSEKDIMGRTVVIHSDPDNFHAQPAGNAEKKIACGVIRKEL